MRESRASDITEILQELSGDDTDTALQRLLPLVYDELRSLSAAYLAGERTDHTLQATALVHEAYIRLSRADGTPWQSRAHFFAAAAKTMRHILIDHARTHRAEKRGGDRRPVTLTETELVGGLNTDVDLVALDESLSRLAAMDPDKAKVVELRVFGGCTIEATAEAMTVSTATVERHWSFARAWLRAELSP